MTYKRLFHLSSGIIVAFAIAAAFVSIPLQQPAQAQTAPLSQCGQACTTDANCVANSICQSGICVNGTRSPRRVSCNPPYPQNACCRQTNITPRTPPTVTPSNGANIPAVTKTITVPPVDVTQAPVNTQPAAPTSGTNPNPIGDCASSAGAGQKDGKTDLIDYELMRQELTKQVTTLHCDFNADSTVDIFDFSDYIRVGLSAS